jgi:hypothetical protein
MKAGHALRRKWIVQRIEDARHLVTKLEFVVWRMLKD